MVSLDACLDVSGMYEVCMMSVSLSCVLLYVVFFARRDISAVFVSVRFLAAQPSRPIQPCHLECLG